MKAVKSILDVLVRRGPGGIPRRVDGLPVQEKVEVFSDPFGIPHIFAANEHDLAVAFGFVQASDRLWQMELLRLLGAGRLSEALGPELADVDHWVRLAGFPQICANTINRIDDETRAYFQGFADGINAFLSHTGANLPLEFRSQGITPEPWKVSDLAGALAYNSWTQQASYKQKMLAVVARSSLTESLWKELFPPYMPDNLKKSSFFTDYGNLNIGKFIPSSLAFDPDLVETIGGSNNWAMMNQSVDAPMLANDPHLGVSVPPVWYFAHLSCPTLNVAGAATPGAPLIVIGRNDHVAWSVSNTMTDATDLVIFRVDPNKPTKYYVHDQLHEMECRQESIPIAGKAPKEVSIYTTIHGPVITELTPGTEAVVCLKWYGTNKAETIPDTTAEGLRLLGKAGSVDEASDAVRMISLLALNFIVGDDTGNIACITSGLAPVRKGYEGNLPVNGSAGDGEWTGFVPPDEMPLLKNPECGWVAAANNQIVDASYPHYISESWCAPYRVGRISDVLGKLDSLSVESFTKLQLDVFSKQAERIVRGIRSHTFSDADACLAAKMLSEWDHTVAAGSAAALVYEIFLQQLSEVLLEDLLGPGISMFLHLSTFIVSCVDVLFEVEPVGILAGRSVQEVCEAALKRTVLLARELCGRDEKKWQWGFLHRYIFHHPGGTGGLTAWLLNRGPYPGDGDGATVRAAIHHTGKRTGSAERFEITHIQSMRMVTSLSGADETYVVSPMGQSGRPGTDHYADMVPLYLNGGFARLPLSRSGAEKIAVSRSELCPDRI